MLHMAILHSFAEQFTVTLLPIQIWISLGNNRSNLGSCIEPFARSSLTTNSLAVSDLFYGLRPAFYSWPHAPHTMTALGHTVENARRSGTSPFYGWYSRFNADVPGYPPYQRHPDDPMAEILRDISKANRKQYWPKTLLEEHVVMMNPYVPPNGRSCGADRTWFNKHEGTVPLLFLPFRQKAGRPWDR